MLLTSEAEKKMTQLPEAGEVPSQQKEQRFSNRKVAFLAVFLLFSCVLLYSSDLPTFSNSISSNTKTTPEPVKKTDMGLGLQTTYPPIHYKYTTLTGYFLQDDPSTNSSTFDFTTTNFGLINRTYDSDSSFPSSVAKPSQWQRFAHHLQLLNHSADKGTRYVLLYLARHGQGYHNVAVELYGERLWDCYYSTLEGDGNLVWADAHLTSIGTAQALSVNSFWKAMITKQGVLTPQRFYTSPLERCLRTARLTWDGITLPGGGTFDGDGAADGKIEVKELLREGNGIHTCDRRSNRTYIATTYPSYRIEAGFQEQDPLWVPDLRESDPALRVRMKSLLDDIFRRTREGEERVFSLTSHGGSTAIMLNVMRHRVFNLRTGAVMPVLVEVVEVEGKEPEVPVGPWQPKPDC